MLTRGQWAKVMAGIVGDHAVQCENAVAALEGARRDPGPPTVPRDEQAPRDGLPCKELCSRRKDSQR